MIVVDAILGAPMLTREDDMDAHALHRRGWTISAIARHLGHDRKTIRAYLRGDREAGVAGPAGGRTSFEPFADYCAARLAEDPHLWATTLFDEVIELGYRPARIRRSPGSCGRGGCGRIASRASRRRAGRWR